MKPVLPLSVPDYTPHPMHGVERVWTETNCSLDVWVELLHALRLDPVPAGLVALSADFQTDQWVFLKFAPEDLRELYGITVDELNVWRPLLDHLDEQGAAGRLLTVEVDSWFLPDTAGVSYRRQHQKSTIVPNAVDREARRMAYFHNAGYWELSGEDFDGVFRLGDHADPDGRHLPPYVELVGIDGVDPERDLAVVAARLARAHLARRPADNPVARLGKRLSEDVAWLREQDLETFHQYAFGVVRQCGMTAELAADAVGWLAARGGESELGGAVEPFLGVATAAKTLQFQLARVARGRSTSLDNTLASMIDGWDRALGVALAWAGADRR